MAKLNDLTTIIDNLLDKYNSKNEFPEWFSTNMKTLLSKNITLEDWNRLQYYLSNTVSESKAIFEFCKELGVALKDFESNLDTELLNVLDTKLDKATTSTSYDQVYAKKKDGINNLVNLTSETIKYSVPLRDANGLFKTSSIPSEADPLTVVNKEYVDNIGGTKLYKHTIDTNMWTVYPNEDVDVNITIEVLSSRPTPYENLKQLSNDIVILRPTNVARFIEGIDSDEYQLIMFVLYSGGDEPYFLAYDYYGGEIKTGYLQIGIFNDEVSPY